MAAKKQQPAKLTWTKVIIGRSWVEYSHYRLGTIYRSKGKYGVRIGLYDHPATSLDNAKRQIDRYSDNNEKKR